MCKSADSRSGACLIAAIVVLVSTTSHLDGQSQPGVGGRVVSARIAAAAASAEPEAFAAALAADRVAAGFVIPAADKPAPASPVNENTIEGQPLPLERVTGVFVRRHTAFSVDDRSKWAPVFLPKQQTACNAILRHKLPSDAVSGPAYEVFWRIARAASPSTVPSAPPATVCAGCNPGAPLNNAMQVALPGTLTVQDALTQAASQAGLVWRLLEEKQPGQPGARCRLAYFDGQHRVDTSYMLARTSAR